MQQVYRILPNNSGRTYTLMLDLLYGHWYLDGTSGGFCVIHWDFSITFHFALVSSQRLTCSVTSCSGWWQMMEASTAIIFPKYLTFIWPSCKTCCPSGDSASGFYNGMKMCALFFFFFSFPNTWNIFWTSRFVLVNNYIQTRLGLKVNITSSYTCFLFYT